MAEKIYAKARFAYNNKPLEWWKSNNPVLENGEPGIVSDATNDEWLKIGDGKTSWNDLGWKKGPQGKQGIRGEKGDSGVYVGTEEPTDPDVMVWVNPDGIADDIPSGGSGTDGADGDDGYTPIRGVDYWTEADKARMVSDVIDSLGGNPVFGVVSADKEIVINGNLSDGLYTVKYEAEDGSTTKIGELVVGDIATESILPMTWTASKTIDSSTGEETDYGDTMTVSGSISLTDGAVYTIKNTCSYTQYYCKINSYWYDASGAYMGRLEHNTELGCAADDYSIPNGAVANISTMEGAASVRFRLNHASGDTENAQNFIKFYITV